jgi:hypothetical protein
LIGGEVDPLMDMAATDDTEFVPWLVSEKKEVGGKGSNGRMNNVVATTRAALMEVKR